MLDALCKWLAKHLLLLLIFSLQPRSLIFSEQRVCLPLRLCRVAACSVQRDVQLWWNICVECAWQWLGQRVGGGPDVCTPRWNTACLVGTPGAAGIQEGEEMRARCSWRRTKSRKYRRRQNARYLSAQRPWRQFELRSISCLAFHPRLRVRVPCFTQWVSHVLLYAHIYSLYLPT